MDDQHDRTDADTLPAGPGDAKAASLTRRAAIGAAIGGIAALAAQAAGLSRPASVAAEDDFPIWLGRFNNASKTTTVDCYTDKTTLHVSSAAGDGVAGESNGAAKSGVYGVTLNRQGYGVFGRHINSHATGALGTPIDGVQGTVDRANAAGVRGMSGSADSSGVVGENHASHVIGALGGSAGVHAQADPDVTDAQALHVEGRVKFSRAGIVVVPEGRTSASVPVAHLRNTTMVFATMQSAASPVTVASASVSTDLRSVVVYLTDPAPGGVTVAYWLLELGA